MNPQSLIIVFFLTVLPPEEVEVTNATFYYSARITLTKFSFEVTSA